MRTAAAVLLLTLCAASAQTARADEDIIVRPKGRPPTEAEGAELPPYPEHAPPRPAGAEYEDQDYFWLNDNDGKQQWEDPSIVLTDDEGTETYVDPNTGQLTDVKPAEAAWLSMWDEEYEHEFFYNELTNETTWSVPYNFAWHKVWVDEDGNVISPHDEEDSFEDGEFVGEEGGELPEWGSGGSYEEDGPWEGEEELADEGPWEDEGGAAEEQPSEEELAEEEVLRQEEVGDVGEL